MDLNEFVNSHAPQENGKTFELENSKLLDVSLDGTIMAKAGQWLDTQATSPSSASPPAG